MFVFFSKYFNIYRNIIISILYIYEVSRVNNKVIISVDKKYFRPAEVNSLLGDSGKARKELKWKPYYDIYSLTKEMVTEELKKINDK